MCSDIATKVSGTNGTNNAGINAYNVNSVGIINLVSINPSSTAPSIEMDINPTTKKIIIYANTGNGSQLIGSVNLT